MCVVVVVVVLCVADNFSHYMDNKTIKLGKISQSLV